MPALEGTQSLPVAMRLPTVAVPLTLSVPPMLTAPEKCPVPCTLSLWLSPAYPIDTLPLG